MAIYIRCPNCQLENKRGDICRKCGTAFPRSGKKYTVRLTVHGRQFSRTAANRIQAERIEAEIRNAALDDVNFPDREKDIPLVEAWKRWESDAIARGKKTVRGTGNTWKSYWSQWADRMMSEITTDDVDLVVGKLLRRLAPKTVDNALILLSGLYRFAQRLGLYTGRNPVDKVERPRVNNKVTRMLTQEQTQAVLAALEDYALAYSADDAAVIRLLMFTGMRRGEVLKLEWRDVDLDARRIHLRDTKSGHDKWLPMNEMAAEALADQSTRRREDCALIFPTRAGGHRKTFHKPWERVKRLAGVPADFRLHDLRHNYASWLASSGKVDLYTLQALMTHSDPRMTQRYAHLFPGVLQSGTDVFADMVKDGQARGGKVIRFDRKRPA